MDPILFYPLVFGMAYLFGSFPSAYLLIKLTTRQDIRKLGSGNVGALNALRSAKSKPAAVLVLALDLLKGALPVWYVQTVLPENFNVLLIVFLGLLLGHLFPVWLKFKGGRGLAVAAGAMLVVQPLLVVIWLVIWGVFFTVIRKHIVASMAATFILPIVVYFTKDSFFNNELLLITLLVCILIFQRHLARIPDLVEEKRIKIQNGVSK